MHKPSSPPRPRYRLLLPLVYLAAVVLLIEDWFWDRGVRLVAFVTGWPPIRALERRIVALPPWAALAAFTLPAVLLFPVKILALLAIAHGHALAGIAVILLAKLGGAAAVARLYALTRPALLQVGWFARLHGRFMTLKDRWIGLLRASAAYRHARHLRARARRRLRVLARQLHPRQPFGRRGSTRSARVVRRFVAQWRARRRQP
ncbi:MAG: hypothetical protein ACXU8N_08205 [Telluria sp.]